MKETSVEFSVTSMSFKINLCVQLVSYVASVTSLNEFSHEKQMIVQCFGPHGLRPTLIYKSFLKKNKAVDIKYSKY